MKPLVIKFYNQADVMAGDGETLEYNRLGNAEPVGCIKARTNVVLRTLLIDMGFALSRLPDMEGKVLDIQPEFSGKESGSRLLGLNVYYKGMSVAQKVVNHKAIDISPFLAVLLRRKPELQNANLVYAICDTGEEHMS